MEIEEKRYYTTFEVAKMISVRSVNTVKTHMRRLPPEMVRFSPGGHARIREDAIPLLMSMSIDAAQK